jgi:hypothetical protein
MRPRVGLSPIRPALAGRDADRSATVAGVGQGYDSRGHRRRRTTARSAAGVSGVPGAPTGAVRLGLGRGPGAELGDVGAAHHQQTGALEFLHQVAGRQRPEVRVAQEARPPVVRFALSIPAPQILEQEGHAAKRPRRQLGRGLPACSLVALVNDRVQSRIQLFDQPDRRLDQLRWLDLAAFDQLGQPDGVVRRVFRGIHELDLIWAPTLPDGAASPQRLIRRKASLMPMLIAVSGALSGGPHRR